MLARSTARASGMRAASAAASVARRDCSEARVELDCGFALVALITAQSARELELNPGDAMCAIVKATSVHVAAHSGDAG